jgi:hypothetical protein
MAKTYGKGIGGVDAHGFKKGTTAGTLPSESLDRGTDVSAECGPAAPRLQRGTRVPLQGPGRDFTSKK